MIANPIQVDGERMPGKPAPQLGADNDDILSEIGYSESEIAKLRGDGVV